MYTPWNTFLSFWTLVSQERALTRPCCRATRVAKNLFHLPRSDVFASQGGMTTLSWNWLCNHSIPLNSQFATFSWSTHLKSNHVKSACFLAYIAWYPLLNVYIANWTNHEKFTILKFGKLSFSAIFRPFLKAVLASLEGIPSFPGAISHGPGCRGHRVAAAHAGGLDEILLGQSLGRGRYEAAGWGGKKRGEVTRSSMYGIFTYIYLHLGHLWDKCR